MSRDKMNFFKPRQFGPSTTVDIFGKPSCWSLPPPPTSTQVHMYIFGITKLITIFYYRFFCFYFILLKMQNMSPPMFNRHGWSGLAKTFLSSIKILFFPCTSYSSSPPSASRLCIPSLHHLLT